MTKLVLSILASSSLPRSFLDSTRSLTRWRTVENRICRICTFYFLEEFVENLSPFHPSLMSVASSSYVTLHNFFSPFTLLSQCLPAAAAATATALAFLHLRHYRVSASRERVRERPSFPFSTYFLLPLFNSPPGIRKHSEGKEKVCWSG